MSAAIARPMDAWQSPTTVATHPAPVGTVRLTLRAAVRVPIVMAIVATVALAALTAIAPPSVFGGTTLDPKCDGVVLRAKPSSSSTRKARISGDARVVAVGTVRGGRWHTKCGGHSDRGRQWYKIVSVNGKSASSLYGRKHVYAARSLFSVVYLPLEAACDGARLRTSPRSGAPAKLKLAAGVKVTASGTVSGGRWSVDCNGSSSGTSWYRVTKIGRRSVSSIYGVTALYAARRALRLQGSVPVPPDTSGYIEGIDVSHWQDTIDWVKVAADGKRFAFMKASEGVKYVDPTYTTNRAQANLNGLKVGAYHFAKPGTGTNDAVTEADHFIATANWAGGDLLPVLDLEVTGGLNDANLQAWVKKFLDRIYAKTGVKAMIYTSPSFWKNNMGDTQQFAKDGYRALWIAHWTTAPSATVPAANWFGNGWTFWQYTSDGAVPGISGRVDLDRYRYADFGRVSVK